MHERLGFAQEEIFTLEDYELSNGIRMWLRKIDYSTEIPSDRRSVFPQVDYYADITLPSHFPNAYILKNKIDGLTLGSSTHKLTCTFYGLNEDQSLAAFGELAEQLDTWTVKTGLNQVTANGRKYKDFNIGLIIQNYKQGYADQLED